MYTFLTGPALWSSFVICLGGLAARLLCLFFISQKKDRIIYNHASLKWGVKSILHWITPYASEGMRGQPVFTFMVFIFHVSLLAVPLFFSAHNILWDESFHASLWSMPDSLADILTIVLVGSGLFLFIRRMMRPEVRILTDAWDYALLILTMLPFVTGFLAFHQIGPYEFMFITHIISSEILLIIIPFSKLSHIILFFFTRAFIGFEMGGRRGARSW